MTRLILLLTLISVLLLSNLASGDQQPRFLEGSGIVSLGGLSLEQAKKEALEVAFSDALSRSQVEVTEAFVQTSRGAIQGNSADAHYRNIARFVRSVTRGRIISYRILSDTIMPMFAPGETSTSVWCYQVRIEAEVQPEFGESDPSFQLELSLNQTAFKESEPMQLKVTASRDCYVTIFNLYSTDSLAVVFPNKLVPENFLMGGSTLVLPPPESGWRLRPALLAGRSNDVEALLAIATKDSIPFPTGSDQEKISQLLSIGDALTTVNRWLADIDIGRRTVAQAVYHIYK